MSRGVALHQVFARVPVWAALSLAILTISGQRADAGDAPGGLVSNSSAASVRRVPPGMRLRSVCESTEINAVSNGSQAGNLLAIDTDGRLRAFWANTAYPRPLPPADLGPVRWAGVGAGPRTYALLEDGTLVQWGGFGQFPGFQPPGVRWKAIGLGRSIAGIAIDGSLLSWAPVGTGTSGGFVQGGPRTIHDVDPAGPYESLDVGYGWGLVVDGAGVARAFGIDAPLPMPIAPLPGVAQVAIASIMPPPPSSGSTVMNHVWMRLANGSVRNLSGTASAPGPYAEISQAGTAPYSILALRGDGGVDAYRQGSWTTIPGTYRTVQVLDVGKVAAAIWDEDADRDGEPDEAQILRGELPDLNGDLIDDSRQRSLDLRDADGDGDADLTQTAAITGTTAPSPVGWYWNGSWSVHRECWAAALRVRRGAEVVDRGYISYRLPDSAPQRWEATFHIWRDPNNDGDPVDAVELLAMPIDLLDQRQAIDFEPILLGQPGDVVFAGYSWIRQQPSGTYSGPGMFSEAVPASAVDDPFAVSRATRRLWSAWSRNTGISPTRMLRGTVDFFQTQQEFLHGAIEDYGFPSQLPMISLAPRRTTFEDCDRSGMLDELELAAESWLPAVDADGDGAIDECQSDCDSDGIGDLDEIAAGSEDCDGDLVPDECRGKAGAGDCDADGDPDRCTTIDCNGNQVPDGCELADGAPDVNGNGVLDSCERDCDRDGLPDAAEIAGGGEADCNANGWIDRCESDDCDGDGISDLCEIATGGDCNENRIPDECDIASGYGSWEDLDGNGIIDICQWRTSLDCDGNGIEDAVQFPTGVIDCDGNGVFDACEFGTLDCDGDGIYDSCEILSGEPDCDRNGVPDACEARGNDCDADGVLDACELASGSGDCDQNGIPDDCEPDTDLDGRADDCEALDGDLDLDGDVDAADLGILLGQWGNCYAVPMDGDLDRDQCVSGSDLGLILTRWGTLPG